MLQRGFAREVVNVDVECCDSEPDDFHAVKALLCTYLDDDA